MILIKMLIKGIKYIKNIMRKWIVFIAKLIDIIFIIFKISVFLWVVYNFFNYTHNYTHVIYKFLILPFLLYFFINSVRLFFIKRIEIVLIELILNGIFIWYYGNNHLFFMGMSGISLIKVYLNKIKENNESTNYSVSDNLGVEKE